jgi:hypothetical protein
MAFLAPALAFHRLSGLADLRRLWLSFTNFQFLSDKPAQWVGSTITRGRFKTR